MTFSASRPRLVFTLSSSLSQWHSYRTYTSMTCVIQMSSAEQDYVIDPLKLWDHIHILAPIFESEEIGNR